ncbi:MAG: tyrosine-type recombinase/integrase [Mesorhizobium sp.]
MEKTKGIEKSTDRLRLKPGAKLYPAQLITDRLTLLYRRRDEPDRSKPKPNGTWVLRRFDPDSKKSFPYTIETIGTADDLEVADGRHVLTFFQAAEKALEISKVVVVPEEVVATTTVGHVVGKYVEKRDARVEKIQGRRVRSDGNRRMSRYVLGQPKRGKSPAIPPAPLAELRIADITKRHLQQWMASLPKSLAYSSTERLCADLKAALNGWYKKNYDQIGFDLSTMLENELKPDAENRTEDGRNCQILSDLQLAKVLAAAKVIDAQGEWEGDLLRMLTVLAATGTRFSQAMRIRVQDFQPELRRIMIPNSRKGTNKKHKLIPVPITDDVVALLRPAAVNRPADEPLLQRWLKKQTGPTKWERTVRCGWNASSDLNRSWDKIRAMVGLEKEIVAYSLRHTSIVRAISADIPLRLVASLHDTSTAVIESTYSAYIAGGLESLARDRMKPLPTLPTDDNVVALRG